MFKMSVALGNRFILDVRWVRVLWCAGVVFAHSSVGYLTCLGCRFFPHCPELVAEISRPLPTPWIPTDLALPL